MAGQVMTDELGEKLLSGPEEGKRPFSFPVCFLALLLFAMPYKLFFCIDQFRQEELFSRTALAGFAFAFLLFSLPENAAKIRKLFSGKLFAAAFLLLFLLPLAHLSRFSRVGPEGFLLPYVYLVIPLFSCLFAEEFRKILPRVLAWAGGILALLTVAGSFIPRYRYHFIHGLPGNRNWNGSLLLAFLPLLLFFLYRLFREKWHFSKKAALLSLPVPFFITLHALWHTASLGTLASLAAAGIFVLLYFLPGDRARKILFAGLCLAGLLAGALLFLHREKILPFLYLSGSAGERVELLKSAFAALWESPFTGNPFSSIEQLLTSCRSEEYFKVLNPAIRSPHPHNHLLYVMMGWGIPGGLFLWGGVLLLLPVLKSFFLLAEEKEKYEEKLLLFALIVFLAHAQLDLILESWPDGTLALLLLGLCWEKSFCASAKKEAAMGRALPAGGKVFFRCAGVLVLLFTLILPWKKAEVMFLKEKLFFGEGLTAKEQLFLAEKISLLAPKDPVLLYDLMRVCLWNGNARGALAFSSLIREGPVPDYARIHMARGQLYLMQGEIDRALEEYRLDAERYPLAVLPVYNMIQIAERNGKESLLPLLKEELERRKNRLKLTPEEFSVMLRDPRKELTPWHCTSGSIYENWKKRFSK